MTKNILSGALAVAFCALILLPVWDTLSAQSVTFPTTGVVNQVANLRGGPSIDNPIVGRIQPNQTITVTGCNPDCAWYALENDTWISASLVDLGTLLPTVTPTGGTSPANQSEGILLPTVTPAAQQTATRETTNLAPTVSVAANLRAGPGTDFPIVGSTTPGQALAIVGRTEAGDWYQLADGTWIAAFLVTNAPPSIPIVASLPTPLPTTTLPVAIATLTPNAAASQPTALPTVPATRPLVVEFLNPHYNCENSELEFEHTPGITERVGGYRSFQIDLYIRNNGTEPVTPQWRPKRWIITNGTDEMINDMSWQWVSRNTGAYPQPTIFPGQVSGWTWMAFPLQHGEWVKAVEFVWQGETYRQEFDLGPYGNAYNYVDCGIAKDYSRFPTPTPRP